MNADIKVNEKVKMYLNELNYGYQFPYLFEGEKYGLVNNLNKLDRPILILGPENDNKYKGEMRIWAYGGSIASVDTEKGSVKMLDRGKEEYANYLKDGFRNNKINPEEFWQDGLLDYLDEPADLKYTRLLRENIDRSGHIDQTLFDLSVFAAYTRYLNRETYKKYPFYPQEKSIQCVIAKNNMLNSRYKKGSGSLLVIDVETHLFSKDGRHPRADFVVFDGDSFGLIEFKYLGKSMDKPTNNLKKHYEDFSEAMSSEYASKLFGQLKMKLQYLMSYGIIDESWQDKCEEMYTRKYDKSVLWCGFYFLGDADDLPGKKKPIVKDRIIKQLEPVYGKVKARCQISKIDAGHIDGIRMDMKDISEVWMAT